VVLLLGGGDKRRQARDIEVARNRLTDFQKRSESR
jgi:putative component of toxin-antitoxin plasmid stabilization module